MGSPIGLWERLASTLSSLNTFSALRHRNFRLFFIGQFFSLVGTWMQSTAQGWLVVLLAASQNPTGETAEAQASLYLSLIAIANSLPVLLGALYGGFIADRYSKRDIILWMQIVQAILALTLAALIYYRLITIGGIILFSLLEGITLLFHLPARQAFAIEIVGKHDLPNAIALNSSLFNSARTFGPALAGLLLSALSGIHQQSAIALCFLLNGLSYLAIIVGLYRMEGDFAPKASNRLSVGAATGEVFAYLRQHDGARLLVSLVATFSLCTAPYFVLLPTLARFALQTDAKQFGWVMSAQGAGALVGALLMATFSSYPRKGRILMLSAITFPFLIVALAFTTNFMTACLLIFGAGFGFICFLSTANTVLQSTVPDELRGRVMGLYSVLLMGLTPLGSLWSGVVARLYGAPAPIAAGSLLLGVTAIVVFLRFPRFRSIEQTLPSDLSQ